MTFRLGSALILIGLLTLIVFLLGLSVQQADLRLLLGGSAVCALGLLLHRRAARDRASADRFRTLRRFFGRPPPPPDDET